MHGCKVGCRSRRGTNTDGPAAAVGFCRILGAMNPGCYAQLSAQQGETRSPRRPPRLSSQPQPTQDPQTHPGWRRRGRTYAAAVAVGKRWPARDTSQRILAGLSQAHSVTQLQPTHSVHPHNIIPNVCRSTASPGAQGPTQRKLPGGAHSTHAYTTAHCRRMKPR